MEDKPSFLRPVGISYIAEDLADDREAYVSTNAVHSLQSAFHIAENIFKKEVPTPNENIMNTSLNSELIGEEKETDTHDGSRDGSKEDITSPNQEPNTQDGTKEINSERTVDVDTLELLSSVEKGRHSISPDKVEKTEASQSITHDSSKENANSESTLDIINLETEENEIQQRHLPGNEASEDCNADINEELNTHDGSRESTDLENKNTLDMLDSATRENYSHVSETNSFSNHNGQVDSTKNQTFYSHDRERRENSESECEMDTQDLISNFAEEKYLQQTSLAQDYENDQCSDVTSISNNEDTDPFAFLARFELRSGSDIPIEQCDFGNINLQLQAETLPLLPRWLSNKNIKGPTLIDTIEYVQTVLPEVHFELCDVIPRKRNKEMKIFLGGANKKQTKLFSGRRNGKR
ncbi:uncharacterized protein LOC120332183 [Styela clava]